jgi:hypothetical protein
LYRWNGSSWQVCANSGWIYNQTARSYISNSRQWTSMPCGGGTYNNLGFSQAFENGVWLGGSRWSGNHGF